MWVTSQNLVKNPSFEDFTDCPNALGTFDANVKHWSTPTGGTTDYFNTCSKVMGAPENFNGVQDPKFGNAYSGIYFYAPGDYREYIQVALHRKLVQGKQYTLDFYISLAEGSDFAVKDFGVLFSQTALNINTKKNITRGQLFRIKGNKHHIIEINHPEFHEDKREWLKIEMEFEAKGFENFLILGNLRDNASTRKVRTKRRESKKGAYYYIDMITLKGEGAMAEAETMATHTTHILKNVHFEYDKYRLDENAKSELAQIYDYLVKNPQLTITIHGHTDAQGTANYNQHLSESRAKTISSHLANLGLPTSRISWQGHGSTRPIAENSTEQGRRKNRRAEFELLEKKD
ncbi:MAG: OmpA family protein [Allomuricauda sp.]|nr:MAG: OmpA family protein [Allomuricauda sp.]